jgi:hypothetical protein
MSVATEVRAMCAAISDSADGGGGEPQDHRYDYDLPPVFILRRRHVRATLTSILATSPCSGDAELSATPAAQGVCTEVTLWIHSSTLGIENDCFKAEDDEDFLCLQSDTAVPYRVARILVRDEPSTAPTLRTSTSAAVLGAFIKRLSAYETALVDMIREIAMHDFKEIHHVGDSVFCGCSSVRELVLPRSITHIGGCAFTRCYELRAISLPNSVTVIGCSAFADCCELKEVDLPNSLVEISSCMFQDCLKLTAVTIHNSVTHIRERAFCRCEALEEVTLPDSMRFIATQSFRYCKGLKSITFGSSLFFIGCYAFNECSSLTHAPLPNSLIEIGERAFMGCTKLKIDLLPKSVQSVGVWAFKGCPGFLSNRLEAFGMHADHSVPSPHFDGQEPPKAQVVVAVESRFWSDY